MNECLRPNSGIGAWKMESQNMPHKFPRFLQRMITRGSISRLLTMRTQSKSLLKMDHQLKRRKSRLQLNGLQRLLLRKTIQQLFGLQHLNLNRKMKRLKYNGLQLNQLPNLTSLPIFNAPSLLSSILNQQPLLPRLWRSGKSLVLCPFARSNPMCQTWTPH